MTDFLDDFDWEDMAMIGGMAQEFADEKRDRGRWDREEYRDPKDDFDFENDFRRRPAKSHYSMRRPRRRPFEQYAYDVARGLKHHHDPLFGPARRRRGMNRSPKNYTDTVLYGVQVKNAHLVSENFLKFICTIFYDFPDQEIAHIVFDSDGNPVFDGHGVFSTFDRGSQIITMNLRRHFANAFRIAEHGYTGFNIHALIWSGMVGTFLHEFKHSLNACEAGYMDYVPRKEQELIADKWASEAKTYYARQGHSEMPELREEPYFRPLVTQLMKKATEHNPSAWVQKQQEMINISSYYRNKEAGIEIGTMQEFYEHSYQGLHNDEFGQHLNACLKRENELEKEVWNHEAMCELALKEAISANHRVRIDHVDAVGVHFSQIMVPQKIISKNYYVWADAIDEKSRDVFSIRVDRIQSVVFLA